MNRFFNWQVDCDRPRSANAADAADAACRHAADPASAMPIAEISGPLNEVSSAVRPLIDLPANVSSYVIAQRDRLSALGASIPEVPVQAVANYSVGYGKQVFFAIYTAARKWQADDAGAMAASVAYYLALSLFPMLLLLTSGLGLVFRFTRLGHDAEVQILSVVAEHCSPTLEQQVREVLTQLREQSLVGGPFGLVAAILAAIGVFYRFERSFDRIWRVQPVQDPNWWTACIRIITQRLSAFCLLTSVGACVIGILFANVAVGFLHAWMLRWHVVGAMAIGAVDASATLLLNAAVFGLLYRLLPKRRIQWIDALRGGLLAAIIWEVGRHLLAAVLIGVRHTAAYGAIGSFIALLLWCYWGVSIIFFGAEYAQVLSDERQKAHRSGVGGDASSMEASGDLADENDDLVSIPLHPPLPSPIIPRRVA